MKHILRNRFLMSALALAALLTASYFLYMEEQGNFHVISHGEAYRSAQLDRDELEHYIKKYNIKSILNLRGRNSKKPWYQEEKRVSEKLNIAHYDLPLSATREPSEQKVRKIIQIFKHAPRPILIHCRGGADRAGLAAAIWKVVVNRTPKKEAAKQLSLLYGHLPLGPTTALDDFFESWAYTSR